MIYGNQALAPRTPDPVVCLISLKENAILVAMDKDMKRIAKKNGVSSRKFSRLSFVHLECLEIHAANRVKEAMSLLEHEWNRSENAVRRLHLIIGMGMIRTVR